MSTFAEGDRVFSNTHMENEPGTVTRVDVEQGVELVSVTWTDGAYTDTTREVATDLYLDDYGDDELAVDRAWAGNTDYDGLAAQADEKMSPPWVDDGYGSG
jgi:hypothetical protein